MGYFFIYYKASPLRSSQGAGRTQRKPGLCQHLCSTAIRCPQKMSDWNQQRKFSLITTKASHSLIKWLQ
jgi:hypothetical protein